MDKILLFSIFLKNVLDSSERRLASSKVALRLDASLRWHDKFEMFWTVVACADMKILAVVRQLEICQEKLKANCKVKLRATIGLESLSVRYAL